MNRFETMWRLMALFSAIVISLGIVTLMESKMEEVRSPSHSLVKYVNLDGGPGLINWGGH